MTKKHFIALADVIKDAPSLFNDTARFALARFCGRQNPQFNEKRWLAYIAGECGPSGGRVKG